MLDFFAEFWENKLESAPLNVDNNSITNGGLTYAASDYCGLDPFGSKWMQAYGKEERSALADTGSARSGRNQRRAKNKKRQYCGIKN
jgi:hypothetical protein